MIEQLDREPQLAATEHIPPTPAPLEDLAVAMQADPFTDQLCWAVRDASLLLGEQHVGEGDVLVGSRQLTWWSKALGRGFAFNYKNIIIHAISRDTQAFARPCIYLQLDSGNDNDGDDDDDAETTEVRLVPQNADTLNTLYEAISICQSLHPDDMGDEEGDDAFVESAHAAMMGHMDAVFQAPTEDQLANMQLDDENGDYEDGDQYEDFEDEEEEEQQ